MNTPIRIKTFRSKTLQDAFQQIRAEFGPDASILETKAARFGMFGRSRIEVTASSSHHDTNTSLDSMDAQEAPESLEQGVPDTRNLDLANSTTRTIDSDSKTESFENSKSERLADSFVGSDSFGSQSRSFVNGSNVLTQLSKELNDAGIEAGIASQWIAALRDTMPPTIAQDIWSLRSELRSWIRDLVHAAPPLDIDRTGQQVLALIGPSGAGKTTSLAKIAANLSMEQGVAVGVLSADSHRLGSNYLLQNYAEVLGWTFVVAESSDHVAECLRTLSHCRIVLVDTHGCSPGDDEALDQLNQLLAIINPTETHLVIPSTCNSRSFLRFERGFESLAPSRMILTKIDEAGGLGAFFSCLQCSSLPVSYLTNGQKIPSDLIQATSIRLAQQILSTAE